MLLNQLGQKVQITKNINTFKSQYMKSQNSNV